MAKSEMDKGVDDIPLTLIEEAAKAYEEVSVRVTRRNDRGQLATVYNNVLFKTVKLAEIDAWLQGMAGGGRFRIECRDPKNKTHYALTPFHVNVEGPPRPPRYLGTPTDMTPTYADETYNAAPGYPEAVQDGNEETPPMSNWLHGMHPSQRAGYMPRERPAPGATVASDQLALKQYQEHKAETARLIAKLESAVERQTEENRRLMDQLNQERERAREERHKVELEMLREQMKLLGERKPEAPKENELLKVAAALAPFAPVLSAMVTSREASASKGLEVQQAGLSTLMQATLQQANKPDPVSTMLTTLGPVVIPLFKEMLDAKSPKAQAELFNSMVENNLNTVAMMAQLIEAFGNQGGDEPWWMAPIKEALGGVVGMTEAYMQGKGGLPGQQTPSLSGVPQAAFANPPAKAVAAQTASTYTTQDAPSVEAPEVEAELVPSSNGNGQSAAASKMEAELNPTFKQKMLLGMLPTEFQTPEWRAIVIGLLNQSDPEQIASLIASHIEHQIDFGLVPVLLAGVDDDPVTVLTRLLSALPIYRENKEYVDTVIYHVATLLIDDEYVEPVEPEHVVAASLDQQPPPAAS